MGPLLTIILKASTMLPSYNYLLRTHILPEPLLKQFNYMTSITEDYIIQVLVPTPTIYRLSFIQKATNFKVRELAFLVRQSNFYSMKYL